MSFENELIPEEMKRCFPFDVYSNSKGDKPTLWKWTVDRERNIYLVIRRIEGGPYEGTQPIEHLALGAFGSVVFVEGEPHLEGKRESGPEVIWVIRKIEIPGELTERSEEVKKILREALEVKGWLYGKTKKVSVKFEGIGR